MVGVTHFDPREAGLNSETRFALDSSRGCAMYADSSLLLQFEVISGLTFRF